MNELVGSALLTILIMAMFYFIVASRLKWGFDSTIAFAFPLLLIGGLMLTGFSAIFAFATVIVGIMIGWAFQQIIKN